MRLLAVLSVLLVAASFAEVKCLTNQEFYDIVEPYLADGDVEDVSGDTENADDDIVLPGGPDDEVDFENVIKQLGVDSLVKAGQEGVFTDDVVTEETVVSSELVGETGSSLSGGYCRCRGSSCSCCYSRRFKVWLKRFTVKVCAYISYSRGRFEFRLTLNGRTVYRRVVRHNLTLCYKVPYTFGYAKACAQLYGINLGRRSFCVRLYAKVWRYRVTFMRKCFRFSDAKSMAQAAGIAGMVIEEEFGPAL